MFTETQLHPREHSAVRVRNYLPKYTMFATSHPQTPKLTSTFHSARGDGSRSPSRRGKAGVVLAIRSEWASPHHLRRFETPKPLLGHLVHVCISLPDSKPFHLVAVYRSNSKTWKVTQQALDGYLATAVTRATERGEEMLLGGDWNAVAHITDRSSGNITTLDTALQATFEKLNLCPTFHNLPTRPHSYRSAHLHGPSTTSRIDDSYVCAILCYYQGLLNDLNPKS